MFVTETLVALVCCGYFVYISNYWVPLQFVNVGITGLAIIFVYFMPETPPFLVASKQFNKAREVYVIIARMNKATDANAESFIFENEISN